MRVNFLDLKVQYQSIKSEIDSAIQEVLDSCAFAGGPYVQAFEEHFAAAHDAAHCVGVNSGTSALHIALMGLEIGPGDEVIVPTNTFFATPEAVSLTGATPVFVDCEPTFYNLDPDRLQAAITENTRAIIPVHLYGQPAQMDRIMEIAQARDLPVIEDCAQAHLARYSGQKVGTFGRCGCFSFYPGKNLGAYGEAGAVVTNDEALAQRLRKLRDHGSPRKYVHDSIGHNYRMSGIQGAVLDVKLRHLPAWSAARQAAARRYNELLADCDAVHLPAVHDQAEHVYHLYVLRGQRRDELMEYLQERTIYTGMHYPIPCHRQKAYDSLGYAEGRFPHAEGIAQEIVSLPMFAELTAEQSDFVATSIREFYRD